MEIGRLANGGSGGIRRSGRYRHRERSAIRGRAAADAGAERLAGAAERQSEVLQVISGSPGYLQPVFTTILENATRVCDAKFGNIYLWDRPSHSPLPVSR
jgi:hypothetical protein